MHIFTFSENVGGKKQNYAQNKVSTGKMKGWDFHRNSILYRLILFYVKFIQLKRVILYILDSEKKCRMSGLCRQCSVDCVEFCGAVELALRGHDERVRSVNPGVFKRLAGFVVGVQEHPRSGRKISDSTEWTPWLQCFLFWGSVSLKKWSADSVLSHFSS